MTSPRFARIAARLMAEKRDAREGDPSPPTLDVRAAAIESIERAIRGRARRRVALRWAYGSSAAAAVIAIGLGGWHARGTRLDHESLAVRTAPWSPPSATVAAPEATAAIAHSSGGGASLVADESRANGVAPMIEGQPLAAGSRVVARPGGRALLAFATGTELTVEDGGDLTIEEAGASKVFGLRAGVLDADVAKLGVGERLVVRTLDAEVEVRGTVFRVAIAPSDSTCGNGTTTRLSVYEGTVVVRQHGEETRVDAGGDWPACSQAKPAGAVVSRERWGQRARSASNAQDRVLDQAGPRGRSASSTQERAQEPSAGTGSAVTASTLADQNDQFADALAAKRAGDSARAIARFESFLAKYPSSALSESAAAQHMKLLRDVDHARAVEAAKGYLARWPNGFAKSDASAILADRP